MSEMAHRVFERVEKSILLVAVCIALIQSSASAAFAKDLVDIRFGVSDKDNRDRLVFDWPMEVAYEVKLTEESATISFARAADFQLQTAREDFGTRLKGAGLSLADPSMALQLWISPGTAVATSSYKDVDGYKVIVDVVDVGRASTPSDGPEKIVATPSPKLSEPLASAAPPKAEARPMTEAEAEEAYIAAFDAMFADPRDPETSFAFVEAAIAAGNVRAAIGVLEQMLLVNPNLGTIKLRVGELLARVGADELAQQYVDQALESEDIPEDIRTRAERIAERAEAKVAADQNPHKVSGSVFVGGRYETNANAGPDNNNIRLLGFEGPFLDDEDTEQDDFSFLTSGALDYAYDFGTQAGHALEIGLFGFSSRYDEETDVNTGLVDGDIGPRFFLGDPRTPWGSIRPFATASYLALDDETYRTAYGGGLNLRSLIGQAGLNVTLRSVYQDFDNTSERQNASDQTGSYTTLRSGIIYEPLKGMALGGGLLTGYNAADEDFESFIEAGVNLFVTQYFGDGLLTERPSSATLSSAYRHTAYDDPDPQIDPDKERRDNRVDLTLSLGLPVSKSFGLSLSGQQTWNESNLPNSTYDNTGVTAGVTYNY